MKKKLVPHHRNVIVSFVANADNVGAAKEVADIFIPKSAISAKKSSNSCSIVRIEQLGEDSTLVGVSTGDLIVVESFTIRELSVPMDGEIRKVSIVPENAVVFSIKEEERADEEEGHDQGVPEPHKEAS